VKSSMPYGHVAYVEAVNSDGTIDISEANWSQSNYVDYRTHVAYWQYSKATFIHPN